jgi:hypothetical protein
MHQEATERDVTQTLYVLHEYAGCAVALFARWKDHESAGEMVEEEADASTEAPRPGGRRSRP